MKKTTISILTPLYNSEKFLAATLDTVVSQTFKDWELILMDGGSKDRSLEIAREYAAKYPNIRIYSEPDEGPYHAIHKALKLAEGDYICVLCASDGYLEKRWLEMCADTFAKNPDVSLVWGVPVDARPDGSLIGPHFAHAHYLTSNTDRRAPFFREALRRLASPASFLRLVKKLNVTNFRTAKQVLTRSEMPRKREWFEYWLETGMTYPDGNMCIAKKVMTECLAPYETGSRQPGDWMSFYFDFNAKGYLSYGLPVEANFARGQIQGSVTDRFQQYNDEQQMRYFKRLLELRRELKSHPEKMVFHDRAGNVIP